MGGFDDEDDFFGGGFGGGFGGMGGMSSMGGMQSMTMGMGGGMGGGISQSTKQSTFMQNGKKVTKIEKSTTDANGETRKEVITRTDDGRGNITEDR